MGKTALIAIAAVAAGLQMGCSSVLTTSNSARAGLFKCGDSGDCRTGVYVSVGDDGDCIVQVLVEKVTIGQGKRPKVVWHLEKADPEGDRFKYQFEPTLGLVIVGNNPTQDFEIPVADGPHKFVTRSINRRLGPTTFKYTAQIQRRARDEDRWMNCTLLDPKIINDGA